MFNRLLNFLRTEECFIEAEAIESKMIPFIELYNRKYHEKLSIYDDGIIMLQNDANKWGLELRLYVRNCPPEDVMTLGFTHNDAYRHDFSYRLNNNNIIQDLFKEGYRIGIN